MDGRAGMDGLSPPALPSLIYGQRTIRSLATSSSASAAASKFDRGPPYVVQDPRVFSHSSASRSSGGSFIVDRVPPPMDRAVIERAPGPHPPPIGAERNAGFSLGAPPPVSPPSASSYSTASPGGASIIRVPYTPPART